MDIENLKFSAFDVPAILITVNENLCIMVPASEAQPAVYVDIPLANITDLNIETPKGGSQRIASQEPPAAVLRLGLSEEFDYAFYLNASQHSSPEIVLFLDNTEDATDVRDWIFHARLSPRVSGSQALAVSQGLMDSLEAIASAAELHDTTTKRDVGALDHNDTSPLFPDILIAVEKPTSPSREDPLDSTPPTSGNTAGATRASLASTTIPVGVLAHQTDGKRRESLSPIRRSVQPSSAPAAFVGQFDEFSERGLTSSAQWTRGMKVIDSASELQVNISESMELVTRSKVDGVAPMVDIAGREKRARPATAVQW